MTTEEFVPTPAQKIVWDTLIERGYDAEDAVDLAAAFIAGMIDGGYLPESDRWPDE